MQGLGRQEELQTLRSRQIQLRKLAQSSQPQAPKGLLSRVSKTGILALFG